MSVALYMDHHVKASITAGLRRRGVDVLTAAEDGRAETEDPLLLDRATQLGRVLFTNDLDFLAEAQRRQVVGISFAGLIYAHQSNVPIGVCIDDLEVISKVYEPADMASIVEYLPL